MFVFHFYSVKNRAEKMPIGGKKLAEDIFYLRQNFPFVHRCCSSENALYARGGREGAILYLLVTSGV